MGGELEVAGPEHNETLQQKFTRLRCEIGEFSEELNSLAEDAREGNLAGLYQQVHQLQENLDVCVVDQCATETSGDQKHLIENVQKKLQEMSLITGENKSNTNIANYELYLQMKAPVTSEALAQLDKRLAVLEKTVGHDLENHSVLSVGTDRVPLLDTLDVLENRKYSMNPDHLSHVEGRLAALTTKLNALSEHKEKVNKARDLSKVTKLFDVLEDRAGLLVVLPDIKERLQDLRELHTISGEWNARTSDISRDQESTETMLAENRALVSDTQALLTKGLEGVGQKLETLNTSLRTLQA